MIGFAAEGDRAVVQIFPLRGGKMIDRYSFHLENVGGQDVTTIARVVLPRVLRLRAERPAADRRPARRRRPVGAGRVPLGAARLARRGAHAERGEKRRLQELADENARHALATEQAQSEQRRARRVEALEELREALNLESLPLRIECFDISHAMGQDPVGSMVVFQDAIPKKADYRKFGIKTAGDDPTTSRRWPRSSRAASRASRIRTASRRGSTVPNLVVVDGGKGQLSAALAAMQAYDLPRVAVIALAKRIEEVFVPGRPDPIVLSRHNPGLQLLQRIRDEAHRFALGFHRQRRESRGFASIFDELEGVGPARRRALLQHFGSVEAMLAARRRSSRACRASRRRPRGASTRSCTRRGADGDRTYFLQRPTDPNAGASSLPAMELHRIEDDLRNHSWTRSCSSRRSPRSRPSPPAGRPSRRSSPRRSSASRTGASSRTT